MERNSCFAMSFKYYREHFYYEHEPAVYYKEVPIIDLEIINYISFNNKKDFLKFIKNIDASMVIFYLKPHSIYELAKLLGRNQWNIIKVILFFESHRVVKIKSVKSNNHTLKKPSVDYQNIEFDLKAA